MTRKYRLLKDLPGFLVFDGEEIKAGATFSQRPTPNECGYCLDGGVYCLTDKIIQANPDWFEEVKEEPAQGFRRITWDKRFWGASAVEDLELIQAQKKANAEASEKAIKELEALKREALDCCERALGSYSVSGDTVRVSFPPKPGEETFKSGVLGEKAERMAPAYRANYGDEVVRIIVTDEIFSSKEEAKKYCEEDFRGWPALPDKDGYYPGPGK